MNKTVSLMSPAGNFDCLSAAIQNGADAVYFGIEQLNMRAMSSKNFSIDDLIQISSICKNNNVKSYLTLNTIIYDHDISIVKKIVNQAKKTGIDAVIASDFAIINYAHSIGLSVHISTQMNVTNIETVKFISKFADTIVLSRELSLSQIKKITSKINKLDIKGPSGEQVNIEIFSHGALCVAVSGKCYMSIHTYNSSANRGACKQNCRKKYLVIDKENGNQLEIDNDLIMSPKDLCTIDFLKEVLDSGVNILKIEGRARSPEYVATVTKQYREAIDSIYNNSYDEKKIQKWMENLNSVYNRGFWSGYYLGKKLGEWSPDSNSIASEKKLFIGDSMHYYNKIKVGLFKIKSNNLKIGDKLLITGPSTGAKYTKIKSMMVNNELVKIAEKGSKCTIPIDFRITASDKIYKIVKV